MLKRLCDSAAFPSPTHLLSRLFSRGLPLIARVSREVPEIPSYSRLLSQSWFEHPRVQLPPHALSFAGNGTSGLTGRVVDRTPSLPPGRPDRSLNLDFLTLSASTPLELDSARFFHIRFFFYGTLYTKSYFGDWEQLPILCLVETPQISRQSRRSAGSVRPASYPPIVL